MKAITLLILILISFNSIAHGSGHTLEFDGIDDFVSLSDGSINVTAASLGLPETAITIECWVKLDDFSFFEGMVSFIQDNGSFEHGFFLGNQNSDKFVFGLSTIAGGGISYLETANTYLTGVWYHLAVTYDGTTMSIYVNGILDTTSGNQSGNISYADSKFVLGKYVDDNESHYMDGKLDEVRIWDTARTELEIRNNMSKTLSGTEVGLAYYWQFDDGMGATLTAQAGIIDGVLTNMDEADWQYSGAAIGDESIHLYTNTWLGEILELNSTNKGNIQINSITGNPTGIQLYRIDSVPNSTTGITQFITNNNVYYGVFTIGGTLPSYNVEYDYSNYPLAMISEPKLSLYYRFNNFEEVWVDTEALINDANNTLTSFNEILRGEFIIESISVIFKDGFEDI